MSKLNRASQRPAPRKVLPRHGQFSAAVVKLPGWRRILTSVYGRLERLCNYSGTTYLSNQRIAQDEGIVVSTAYRHIKGLLDCGAVMALYGRRTECPGHKFNGVTRWLLTMGPFFGKGYRTALRQSEGTVSFFSDSPLTIKEDVLENLWRFLAHQEAFYPGSTRAVAEAFFKETGVVPEGSAFTGEFDESFFDSLISIFCSEDICKIANRSVPYPSDTGTKKTPARAKSPDAGDPASEVIVPIPGKKVELSESSGSAVSGAIATTLSPGEIDIASTEGKVSITDAHIRVRRLAYYFPEEFDILCTLFPEEPPTAWTPNEARRILRQLGDHSLTVMHLRLLRDYTPENRKRLVTIENFFNLTQRDILLQRAARNFRTQELGCFGQWEYGVRMDTETVILNFNQFCYKHHDPEGFNEILAGTMTEFPNGKPDAIDWAGHVTYIFHAKWLERPDGFPPFIDVFTGSRNAAPILLAESAKDPLAWRAMLRLGQMLGADQFKAAYHFSIDDLKAAVTARCEWLHERAKELEDWDFINETYDPELDTERVFTPSARRYDITKFKHLLDERFDY